MILMPDKQVCLKKKIIECTMNCGGAIFVPPTLVSPTLVLQYFYVLANFTKM